MSDEDGAGGHCYGNKGKGEQHTSRKNRNWMVVLIPGQPLGGLCVSLSSCPLASVSLPVSFISAVCTSGHVKQGFVERKGSLAGEKMIQTYAILLHYVCFLVALAHPT